MKAFRNWWKKDRLYVKDLPTPIIKDYDKQVKLCGGVWRAALTEVLRRISQSPDGSIVTWIAEELDGD